MRWRGGRRSENVEDRRGQRSSRGGFRFPFPTGNRTGGTRIPVRRGGIGGIGLIIIVVLVLLFGGNLGSLLQQAPVNAPSGDNPGTQNFPQMPDISGRTNQQPQSSPTQRPTGNDDLAAFISVVLADTEDTWNSLFAQFNQNYREPKLVLFEGVVRSACGTAQAAVGPFYCPSDQKVYIDLSFYRDLRDRFGAPGDFAQAYVIAHEVGHHVQTLLGISERVRAAQSGAGQAQANAIQVRMELQADCLAGVWAHHADKSRNILEEGDVEEAMNAAEAIGDDRIQRRTQGHVVPDAFTHGTSEQRRRWFTRGLQTGNMRECDTFNIDRV